jgi:Na+/proline symporter
MTSLCVQTEYAIVNVIEPLVIGRILAPLARRRRAYQATTIVYGVLAALVAWLGPVGSILDLLLFGFAMVVPPAIAAGFVLYWPRTTEAGLVSLLTSERREGRDAFYRTIRTAPA